MGKSARIIGKIVSLVKEQTINKFEENRLAEILKYENFTIHYHPEETSFEIDTPTVRGNFNKNLGGILIPEEIHLLSKKDFNKVFIDSFESFARKAVFNGDAFLYSFELDQSIRNFSKRSYDSKRKIMTSYRKTCINSLKYLNKRYTKARNLGIGLQPSFE